MKTKNWPILSLFFILCCGMNIRAQPGFFIPKGERSVDIPFELKNNFIIINLMINNRQPLSFIFDSGAGQTIVIKKDISGVSGIKYDRTFHILGSDLTKPLTAYLCRGVRIEITEKVIAPQDDILVLDEDCFQFEEFVGMNIYGILSAHAFARYYIKINYDKKVITLFDRERFVKKELKGFERIPVEINREKPYFYTTVRMTQDSAAPVKLLLDTGAGMPLLLFTHTNPLLKPPANAISANIGMGLGGNIEGVIGRITGLAFAGFDEKNVITYFQQLDTSIYAESASGRNGVIGNGLLRRYVVVFDYINSEVWLKAGKEYRSDYSFDRSGLSIIAAGVNMTNFIIQNVVPGSPAAEADFRKGDRIVKVGRNRAFFITLAFVLEKLHGKPGKKVTLTIDRGGERIKKTIVLRDFL